MKTRSPGVRRHPPAPPAAAAAESIDATDRAIINALQGGFPICAEPFKTAAEPLGIAETELIARIGRLLQQGVLTRFGPLYNADRLGGANVLAAMALPEEDFDRIAAFVNAQPEIAHNYRRDHALNLWFVGAAETPEKVESVFRYIEGLTGYPVYRFPKEREFFVELRLAA